MNDQQSKQQIIKSTGVLGSVQILTILIGLVRIKVLAILLGPVGVGIAGIYQTTIAMIGSATGLGINFSGVRDVAASAATNNEEKLARTVIVLRRWTLVTGVLGMLLTIALSPFLSRISFGNESYAWGISMMSITLLLSATTGGMNALLQGMRRINDLAKANILSAIIGLIGAVIIYYFWALKGIVPALLFTFAASKVATWYYARKISIPKVQIDLKDTYKEGLSMARLGFFMVITVLMNHGFMYVVRSHIMQKEGIAAVGHFVAAWTISTMYISAIFGAMAADYYPRLSGIQANNDAVRKLVNDQSEIALLLTFPIIIGMVSFIGLVVNLFYSKDFGPAAEILSWQLLGDVVKVLGHPLGFVLLAKAKGKLVIITELFWNIFYLGFVYFGWNFFGIEITGIAFLAAYVFNVGILYFLLNRTIGFRWSRQVWHYLLIFLPVLVLAFLNTYFLIGKWQQYSISIVLTFSSAYFSFSQLRKFINLPALVQKMKMKLSPGK